MTEALNQAFTLLGIGMISVFAVLAIVVLTGKILIRLTNRLDLPSRTATSPGPPAVSQTTNTEQSIDSREIAVVAALIDHLTEGRGQLSAIRRLDEKN